MRKVSGKKDARIVKSRKKIYDKGGIIEETNFNVCDNVKRCVMGRIGTVEDDGLNVVFNLEEGTTYERPMFFTADDEEYDDIIHGLTNKAFILFKYIKHNVPLEGNCIELRVENVARIVNEKYFQNTYKIIRELIASNLIAKSPTSKNRHIFTINHNLFFRGNYNKFVYNYSKIYGDD